MKGREKKAKQNLKLIKFKILSKICFFFYSHPHTNFFFFFTLFLLYFILCRRSFIAPTVRICGNSKFCGLNSWSFQVFSRFFFALQSETFCCKLEFYFVNQTKWNFQGVFTWSVLNKALTPSNLMRLRRQSLFWDESSFYYYIRENNPAQSF